MVEPASKTPFGLPDAVPRALSARGVAVTPRLRAWLDEIDRVADAPALIELALECRDADDFLRRAGDVD